MVLPIRFEKLTPNWSKNRCEFSFYLCSCFSTQFLYRTAAKATFNVKDNINIVRNISITLTINITTSLTKNRIVWWQNHICLFNHFLHENYTTDVNYCQEQIFAIMVYKNKHLACKVFILFPHRKI